MAERKANWMRADAKIMRLNQEHPSALFGHNKFSDLHKWELDALTGLKVPTDDADLQSDDPTEDVDLPIDMPSIDGRHL